MSLWHPVSILFIVQIILLYLANLYDGNLYGFLWPFKFWDMLQILIGNPNTWFTFLNLGVWFIYPTKWSPVNALSKCFLHKNALRSVQRLNLLAQLCSPNSRCNVIYSNFVFIWPLEWHHIVYQRVIINQWFIVQVLVCRVKC